MDIKQNMKLHAIQRWSFLYTENHRLGRRVAFLSQKGEFNQNVLRVKCIYQYTSPVLVGSHVLLQALPV